MAILRHPKTFGELRANQDGFFRAKRSGRKLPTVYSDILVNTEDRSWKRFRKTRWKAI